MTISSMLYSALAGTAAISAIVSNRIYPLQLPQQPTYEAISYQRVSNAPQVGSTQLRETRYQINCWAQTYADAQTLAAAVKVTLEEYRQNNSPLAIKMGRIANEIDDYDAETNTYRVIVDVLFNTYGD